MIYYKNMSIEMGSTLKHNSKYTRRKQSLNMEH